MPTPVSEVMSKIGGEAPQQGESPPDSGPKLGRSVSDVMATLKPEKKAPSRVVEGVKSAVTSARNYASDRLAPVVSGIGEGIATGPLGQMFNDASAQTQAAVDQLKKDPSGYTGDMAQDLLHTLGTLNDVIQATPLATIYGATVGRGLDYIRQDMQSIVDRLKDAMPSFREEVQDEQARRLGQPVKQKSSLLGRTHQEDLQWAFDKFNDIRDAVVNSGLMFVGGEKGVAERQLAAARTALRDVRRSFLPEEPRLEPVTLSLDKTLGFHDITQQLTSELNALPDHATLKSGDVVDKMLPHAKGYAKEFLTQLRASMDPNVPVTFKRNPGDMGSPESLGGYAAHTHSIDILQHRGGMIHTTVHEIVHSSTIHMMNKLQETELLEKAREWTGRADAVVSDLNEDQIMATMKNPQHPLLKEIDAIRQEATYRARLAGKLEDHEINYALEGGLQRMKRREDYKQYFSTRAWAENSPRYEWLAQVFSQPEVLEFLANSEKYASAQWKNKYGIKTGPLKGTVRGLLNSLTRWIANGLGLKGHQNMQLLSQAMRTGMDLIRMQDREKPPITHMSNIVVAKLGEETITARDMELATNSKPIRSSPAASKARNAFRISIEQLLRTFHPEGLGERAKLAAATIARSITELEQKTAAWKYGSRTREKFWRARPDLHADFLEKFEKGEKFNDPVLSRLAQHYREWNERIFQSDVAEGFKYEPRDNYMYHLFEDEDGVANYFTEKYGTKWGDPKFIKDRSFDLYKEAIKAGFKPRFTNPEDIMLARQHASDLAHMQAGLARHLEKFGLAVKKVKSSERLGYEPDPERPGKVRGVLQRIEATEQPPDSTPWRSPTGEIYWVNNEAHAVLKNAFLSKSLWGDKSLVGVGFRGMMGIKNTLVPIRLALSLFHPLHVAGIDLAAGWTRATSELLSGHTDPLTWFAKSIKSGYDTAWGNHRLGSDIIRAWRGEKVALSAADTEALRILNETGIAPELSSQFRTNVRENWKNALLDTVGNFRAGKPVAAGMSATRAALKTPFAALSALQKPFFEHWIPSLKAAAAIKDAKSFLARNPNLSLPENEAERIMAMRRIGKSVENRYGEMNYNKLFWKRWMKDLAVLDTLSLGWQLGFMREYGGGALDLKDALLKNGRLQRIKRGELDRAIFVANYTVLGAGLAGLMTYSMTGQMPVGLDWISPRTGEKNPDGSDQRVSTMFYSREFASLYKHMQNEGTVEGISHMVLNKGSGMFGLMHEMFTGKDSFGKEYRDPNGDPFKQMEESLAYVMSDLEPISIRAIRDNVSEQPGKQGVLSVLGFTPAPKYLTESVAVGHIKVDFEKYIAAKATPFEKAEYSKEYSALRRAYQSGDDSYPEKLEAMAEKFQMSAKDQRRLIRSLNATEPPEVRMFIALGRFKETQRRLLDEMSPEERNTFLPHANKEVRSTYVPPEDRR